MTEIILMLTVLVAGTVQSMFGFGLALFVVPILSSAVPFTVLTPLLSLISITLSVRIAWKMRVDIQHRLLGKLLVAICLGMPLGIAMIVHVDVTTVRMILGILLIAYCSRALFKASRRNPASGDLKIDLNHPAGPPRPLVFWSMGFIVGVLGSAYNLMGPPLVLLLQWSRLNPQRYRATIHAFSVMANVLILIGFWFSGQLRAESFVYYGYSLVPLLLAYLAGNYLLGIMDAVKYTRYLYALLLLLGINLLLTTLPSVI